MKIRTNAKVICYERAAYMRRRKGKLNTVRYTVARWLHKLSNWVHPDSL